MVDLLESAERPLIVIGKGYVTLMVSSRPCGFPLSNRAHLPWSSPFV